MREGIEKIKEPIYECENVKQAIFGNREPSFNPRQEEVSYFSQNLNNSQQSAIKFCLSANGKYIQSRSAFVNIVS